MPLQTPVHHSRLLDLNEKGEEIDYPCSDGQPMANSDRHRNLMMRAFYRLTRFFRNRPDAYVSADSLIYWKQGVPSARVAPDLYVVFGVPAGERDSFRVWNEGGRFPAVVFELDAYSTICSDWIERKDVYERIFKVHEYYLFDLRDGVDPPRLKGFRREGCAYADIPQVEGRLRSEALGLDLSVEGVDLVFYEPETGACLLSSEEGREQGDREAAPCSLERERADREATGHLLERERADRAEAELARLRAMLGLEAS